MYSFGNVLFVALALGLSASRAESDAVEEKENGRKVQFTNIGRGGIGIQPVIVVRRFPTSTKTTTTKPKSTISPKTKNADKNSKRSRKNRRKSKGQKRKEEEDDENLVSQRLLSLSWPNFPLSDDEEVQEMPLQDYPEFETAGLSVTRQTYAKQTALSPIGRFNITEQVHPGVKTESEYGKQLCGYPVFYDAKKCKIVAEANGVLSECENKEGMVAFGSTIVLLALFIVVSNCLLPIALYRQPALRNHHAYIKVSLCFADMIMGFILLFSVLPSMFWFRNSTEREVVTAVSKKWANSAVAVVSGSLLSTTAQASLMHLMFLSIERFVAIKWTIWYRGRKTRTIFYILGAVWFSSLLFAFIPAACPDKFGYTFIPVVFLYMLNAKQLPDETSGYHGPIYAGVTMLIPYTIMVFFSVMTGVTAWRKLKFSRGQFSSDLYAKRSRGGDCNGAHLRLDFVVFKTMLIVIIAFSLTLLPVVVVFILYHIGYINCNTYALPYTVSFYLSTANSFVNVLVYSARDKRFRSYIASLFLLKELPTPIRKKKPEKNDVHSATTSVIP